MRAGFTKAGDRTPYRVQKISSFGATLGSARQPVLGGKRPDLHSKLRFWRFVAAMLAYVVVAETLVLAIR